MNPVTHSLIGWTFAQRISSSRREQAVITLAGILPDLDGLGLPFEALSEGRLDWYSTWHHSLSHNLVAGILLSAALTIFSRRSAKTTTQCASEPTFSSSFMRLFLACLFSNHLHLLGDLIGARGPDGDPWPIPYFAPFSSQLFVSPIQWEINAWPNILLTIVLLGWVFRLAWKEGFSPLSYISTRADKTFISALRQRFGEPIQSEETGFKS